MNRDPFLAWFYPLCFMLIGAAIVMGLTTWPQ